MPAVELLAVGTEILLGQLTDTNTPFVAAALADAGIDVRATHAVGDNRERIAAAIRSALARSDGVVSTGGLGPTVDDVTKEAVCDALGLGIDVDEPALEQMKAFFAAIGREMRPNNVKQAEVPAGSYVLGNPHGTAPGFVAFAPGGGFVACMPGVPREMKPMLATLLVPYLRERLRVRDAIYTRVLHTIGMGESEIDHRIEDLFRDGENPKIAVLAHGYRADVKLMAKAASSEDAQRLIEPLEREIEGRLGDCIYGVDADTPAGAILTLLERQGRVLAVAESCTGGRIASAFTAVPGASRCFLGGVVAYANTAKVALLGVNPDTLERCGAVSEEVVREMAAGVRSRMGADIGVATTGIAGPGGGSEHKPVGTVWFALDDGTSAQASLVRLHGNRSAIMDRATTLALGMLWRRCRGQEP